MGNQIMIMHFTASRRYHIAEQTLEGVHLFIEFQVIFDYFYFLSFLGRK